MNSLLEKEGMAGTKDGWAKLAKNLKAQIDQEKIEASKGTLSLPFKKGDNAKIAVKIIDDWGIESLRVSHYRKVSNMFRLTDYFPKANLEEFCRDNHIIKMALFGSALSDELKPDSDIDILVEFDKSHMPGLFDIARMEIELTETFGRKVDLRTPEDLSRYFRDDVVRTDDVPEGFERYLKATDRKTFKLRGQLGMTRRPHLIVMDEPTNHLDLPSIECFEDALADCPCGLLLVSHDMLFLRHLATTRWLI